MSWTPKHESRAHQMREQNEQRKHPGPRARTFPSDLPAEPWFERRLAYLLEARRNGRYVDPREIELCLELRRDYYRMLNRAAKRNEAKP